MDDEEIEEPAQLSPDAQKAMDMAEQKAEQRRQKHMLADQETAARAAAVPPDASSGICIDPSGGAAPGVKPLESPAPVGHSPMPESTPAPRPMPMAVPEPEQASAADMLVPADAQRLAREEAGRAAFAMVEEQRAARRGTVQKQRRDVMYYVRCQSCGGPGIWMNTRGVIGPDDWWSNYKPRGVPWPSKVVWCQCCWALREARNPLKILHTTVNDRLISMKAYPRMVVEIDVSEYKRLIAVPTPEPVGADG